jgi:bacillolysin
VVSKTRNQLNDKGAWHAKFIQVFQGIPVKDGHMAMTMRTDEEPGAHLDLDEAVRILEQEAEQSGQPVFPDEHPALRNRPVVHMNYLSDPEVNTQPVISPDRAMQIVREMVHREVAKPECHTHQHPEPDQGARRQLQVDTPEVEEASLAVHPGEGAGRRKLTYHTIVSDTSTACPVQMHAWVGAQADVAGQVLESYNNIQTIAGTGRTFYQGQPSYFEIAYWPTSGSYVLNDLSLRIGAYDAYNSCSAVYQASSGSPIFGNFALSNRNSTNADTLWATVQTMSYYYYNHARNYVDGNYGPKVYQAVDGAGALLSAVNHVCSGYNNAYWDGSKINLGDGNGSTFRSFATLDIIGHEWTHGVTQFEANLQYTGESGALNESFSDIFGAMAERYWKGERSTAVGCPVNVPDCGLTWKIGEEAYTPSTAGDALRYMYRPTLDGASRDHYSQRYTGTADNGGVHWNSGIQNNAFYLLAKGGCHRFSGCMNVAPSVNGIGADAAKTIFYLALRDYLISNDNFYWARRGTQYEAGALYGFGSVQYYTTKRAWDLVGAP